MAAASVRERGGGEIASGGGDDGVGWDRVWVVGLPGGWGFFFFLSLFFV